MQNEIHTQSFGFISCEYNNMNLEKKYIFSYLKKKKKKKKDNVYTNGDFLTG